VIDVVLIHFSILCLSIIINLTAIVCPGLLVSKKISKKKQQELTAAFLLGFLDQIVGKVIQ